MAENKVNKSEQEEKKNNKGFIAWWKGLKNLYKGLIIGGTVAVLATAITLPIVLTRNKGSSSGVQVTKEEWKAAFDKINPINPSKLGNFTLNIKGNELGVQQESSVKNVNYKHVTKNSDDETSFCFYEENATTNERIAIRGLDGTSWSFLEGTKATEPVLPWAGNVILMNTMKDKYSSFTFTDGKYSINGYPYDEMGSLNQIIEFDNDKNIKNIKTSISIELEDEIASQFEYIYSDYGTTKLPDNFPKDSLPEIVELNYDDTTKTFKSSSFNYKKDKQYAFRIPNSILKKNLGTIKVVDSNKNKINTTFINSSTKDGVECLIDNEITNEATFSNPLSTTRGYDVYIYAKAEQDMDSVTCELTINSINAKWNTFGYYLSGRFLEEAGEYKGTIIFSTGHNFNTFSIVDYGGDALTVNINNHDKQVNVTSIKDSDGNDLIDSASVVGPESKAISLGQTFTATKNVIIAFTINSSLGTENGYYLKATN